MKPTILKLAALVLGLALTATTLHAAPVAVSEADKNAYFAIGDRHSSTRSTLQTQTSEVVKVRPIDEAKLCTIYHGQVADILAEKAEKLTLLRQYEQDNKAIDPLISSFLVTSDLADTFIKAEAGYCANTKVAAEKGKEDRSVWESVYLAEALLDKLKSLRESYAAAVKTNDRLVMLSDLQSRATFLDETIFHIDLLRRYTTGAEPRIKALVARLAALKAEYAEVKQRSKTEIKAYTDPQGLEDKPYVYTPLVIPAVPDNDDDFNKIILPLVAQASKPMMKALSPLMKGDTQTACPWVTNGLNDLIRLQAFVEAYIAKRTAAGADVTNARKMLGSINSMIDTNKDMAGRSCAQ